MIFNCIKGYDFEFYQKILISKKNSIGKCADIYSIKII